MTVEVFRYVTAEGRVVVSDWLASLRDQRARAKVIARFARLSVGNFGDSKLLRNGVHELRIDTGPGYRVYFAMADHTCVLLLCGGDKRTQAADIERAIVYWDDYKTRTKKP